MWSYSGCCSYGHGGQPSDWPHHHPHHHYHHHPSLPPTPKEIIASTAAPTASAQIGGVTDTPLSLDFLKDTGAPTSSIKVTVTDPSGSGVWTISTIPDGFQDRANFLTAAPGAKVELAVTGCTAQLSWFERQP